MTVAMSAVLRVFFFGDSICFGQGVSPHRTWVSRLAGRLEQQFAPRIRVDVQNPSINGNTTRMALERMPYDLQSHAPDVVYVQFGLNDCNGWETDRGHPRVSRAGFAANLAEIIDRARLFGARQVVLGTNHPTTRTTSCLPYVQHTYEQANLDYNAVIRQVAANKATLLADAELAFHAAVKAGRAGYADLVLADQLHLSEAGHDIYLASHLPILCTAVEQAMAAR